jgi:hypothetical protein
MRFELKTADHEIHQMIPAVKDHVPHSGLDIMEKRLTPGNHLAKQGVLVIAPLQHRMEQKGSEIQAEHTRREILLPERSALREFGLGVGFPREDEIETGL